MKTLASLAVAATVGLAALIGPAQKAEAGDAGAAIAGFAIGAIVGSHLGHGNYYYGSPNYYHRGPSVQFYYGPPPRPRYYHRDYYRQPYYEPQWRGSYSAHTQWCLNQYRTYNPYTNLYFYRAGRQRQCISPYS
jgi:BA14K-like protein